MYDSTCFNSATTSLRTRGPFRQQAVDYKIKSNNINDVLDAYTIHIIKLKSTKIFLVLPASFSVVVGAEVVVVVVPTVIYEWIRM